MGYKTAIVVFVLTIATIALGYQDPLQLYDPIYPLSPGFILSGGYDSFSANRSWSNDGQPSSLADQHCSESNLLIPIRIGYAPTNLWHIDAVLPLVQPKTTVQAMGSTVTSSSFGLSNPWLAGSYMFAVAQSNVIRPRLAVKFPLFATTLEDYIAPGAIATGDKNVNLDLTLNYAFISEKTQFTVQAWLAGRYAFAADYEIEGVTSTRQPPFNIASEIAPGWFWDQNGHWQTYAVANLMLDARETALDGYALPNSKRARMAMGLRQAWVPAPEGELIFDFSYGLSGTNISTGFEFGLGYFGYLQMNG